MRLAEIPSTAAGAATDSVALLPVGSTEQHGAHAPLGTDTVLAEAVATRGAAVSEAETVIAPAIPIGVSEEHRAFPGSLWITPDTFRAIVRETASSLAYHGWDRIVIVNGHGGNVAATEEVAARLTRDGTASTAAFTWFDAIDLPPAEMGHGGPVETSALLAAAPDLVREEGIAESATGAADRWGRWVGGVNVAYDSDEFSESGIVGDPRDADATRGEELLAAAATNLATLIDDLA